MIADGGRQDAYPVRPRYWAMKLIRLLAKTCAAQEIGPTGYALVSIIVTTEDAAGYRRAVTFFDGQLCPILGVDSQKSLAAARRRCVEAGWLHYEPGGKGRPGRYWATLPDHAEGIDDHPTDEGDESPDEMRRKIYVESGNEKGIKTEAKGNETGNILPIPIPRPIPEEKRAPSADPPSLESELIQTWNGIGGIVHVHKMTDRRKRSLKARLTDEDFAVNWRPALVRIAKSSFCRGMNERGWRADLDWFLRPDTITKILEGKYDERNGSGHRPVKRNVQPDGRSEPSTDFDAIFERAIEAQQAAS